jgi:hypothetical protein
MTLYGFVGHLSLKNELGQQKQNNFAAVSRELSMKRIDSMSTRLQKYL